MFHIWELMSPINIQTLEHSSYYNFIKEIMYSNKPKLVSKIENCTFETLDLLYSVNNLE